MSWTDNKGNLWLFGGDGWDSANKMAYLNDLWEFSPSTNLWAWMGGVNIVNDDDAGAGVTGTLGVPAAGNLPEGRQSAVTWTDPQGNLWLFGGYNYAAGGSCASKIFNDLWEFNPVTGEWAWMSGTSQDTSTELNGACAEAGVYGTLGTASSGNVPGSRSEAVSWTDSKGNLWLFGGSGVDSAGASGDLNDLWEFSPSTGKWTWMGGGKLIQQSSVAGTLGKAAKGNIPGSRDSASGWTDPQGNFWLFGGSGYDAAGNYGQLNDLWEFNLTTNQWAWISGSSSYATGCAPNCGQPGIYGTFQTPAAGNVPGDRQGAVSWTDSQGNLWLLGGYGIDAAKKLGFLNDLWRFNPTSGEWTWMSGSSTVSCAGSYCEVPGIYGTLLLPSLGNTPGSREYAANWTDNKGNLWVFGGTTWYGAGSMVSLEDLWEFQPNTNGLPITATPTFSPDSGTYTTEPTVTISDTTPGATIYYLINGNPPASEYTGPIAVASSQTIQAIAGASGYANSNVAAATYTADFAVTAVPTFSVASGDYATAQTVSIMDATTGATIYYTTDGSMPTTSSPVYGSPITVSSSETIEAIAVVSGSPSSAVASAVYTIGSTGTLGEWAWMGGSSAENQPGIYGTLLTSSAGNIPGARYNATSLLSH